MNPFVPKVSMYHLILPYPDLLQSGNKIKETFHHSSLYFLY